MLALALLVLALSTSAAACDVCAGRAEFAQPVAAVELAGDLRSCACEFVFAYSGGATPGRATLVTTPGVGSIEVFGGPDSIAQIPAETAVNGTLTVFAQTGTVRVVYVSLAGVAADARLSITVESINQAPALVEREDLEIAPVLRTVLFPFTGSGTPQQLPVTVSDPDNLGRGLRIDMQIEADISNEPTFVFEVPAVPDVVVESSTPRRVVISGPGDAVEAAFNNARLVPIDISLDVVDELVVVATDDGGLTSRYSRYVGVYPVGDIETPRGAHNIAAGILFPPEGAQGAFHVHDAVRIDFLALSVAVARATGECVNHLKVWDGPDTATARLLSTDLTPSGEICGYQSVFLPTYSGTTGEFVIEFSMLQAISGSLFDAAATPAPVGFRSWLLGGDRVVEVVPGGAAVQLPLIMITSLPDPTKVRVEIVADSGSISLRFSDSFVDLIDASEAPGLSLVVTELGGAPAMLRMGDALREVHYTPTPDGGPDTVTVRAWSGGEEAAVLQIPIVTAAIALNAPESRAVSVFRPVRLEASVVTSSPATVSVSVQNGLGLVSVDPRAAAWVGIGYASELSLEGSADEINAALAHLVFRGTLGGVDVVALTADGGARREITITVDPECEGEIVVYAREGTVTERTGPPTDRYSPDLECVFQIHGPRQLSFPYYDVPIASDLTIVDELDRVLFFNLFTDPGTIFVPLSPFVQIEFAAIGGSSGGFVASFAPVDGVDDPPLVVVPRETLRVVRESTTLLHTLYIDDFAPGVIEASLETDAGSLQEEGVRAVSVVAASFAELDEWITGIEFLAGDVQTTATLTLTAADAAGGQGTAQFQIEVLPCSGTAEVKLAGPGESATIEDGSGTADYAPDIACGWRATGLPGPAVLSIDFLNMDCDGDAVTVYDGSSPAGRLLGSFCQSDDVATQVGTLVSSTGSFFVALSTNPDDATDDGFAFVYTGVTAGSANELGAAPRAADPFRTDATVVALESSSVAVFGGHTGVRAVASTLVFAVGTGWRVLAGDGPSGRSRAAGVALSASRIVVHGGIDSAEMVVAETWVGDIAEGTIAWTQLNSTGPATAAAAMHVFDGSAYLVDASRVWILADGTEWQAIGPTPETVVATSSACRPADGRVYAAGQDGTVWLLSLPAGTWAPLEATLDLECAPWACSGAMLGTDEYVVAGQRVNTTSLAVSVLPAATTGQTVGGSYFGQPSLFVYSSGAMVAVPLTLEVSSHLPRVSPSLGGTVIAFSGERLSSCDSARCSFGGAATIESDRRAVCTTPAGAVGSVAVGLVCADGRRYESPDSLAYFGEPTIEAIEPATPAPGDTVLVTLGGVAAETLAAVVDPLCRFDDGADVPAVLDGAELRCRVPETASRGGAVTLEISLDGQQFGSATSVPLASSTSSLPVLTIALVGAAVLVVFGAVLVRYRQLANSRVAMGPAPWEIAFDALELLEVVGTGAYGSVHRGRFRGGEVAVKVSKAETLSEEVIEAFRKESALMAELRHPNIVLFMGACTTPPNIAIVLEFLPHGSLFDLLQDEQVPLPVSKRLSFALDIAKGMAYLHGADPPIVHRDLKSLNVLVDKSWTMKVSDFGLTEIFHGGGDDAVGKDNKRGKGTLSDRSSSSSSVTFDSEQQQLGSVHWMAPERFASGAVADRASDVYSFAVTLWEIATREVPYDGGHAATLALRLAGDPTFRPNSDGGPEAGPPFDEIIDKCWAVDPERRPTFVEIQALLEGVAADEASEQTGSFETGMAAGDKCAAVVRLTDAHREWERDPVGARALIERFRSDAERLCADHRGRMLPGASELALCLFETVAEAAGFARGMLGREGLPISGGIAFGLARETVDVMTQQRRFEGAAIDGAWDLARRAGPGRIAARRADMIVADPGIPVVEIDSHTVAMVSATQPSATATSVEQTDPSWVIRGDELEIGQLIGAGSFGTVFRAMWRGAPVAAKQLHRKKLGAKDALDLQMESGIASKLRHPNVCLVLGVCRDLDAGKVFVVSEYMSKGSVFEAIVTARKEIAAKHKVKVARGMALGLRYLHEQSPPIVHRSLTARNVLLGEGWTAKISDFGLARVKDGAATMTKIGSTAYSAPELLRGERYDEKADVYAYAMVVWEMAAQEVAFGSRRLGHVALGVLKGMRPPIADEWRSASGFEVLVEVMERCWEGDPERRPGTGKVGQMLGA